MCSIEEAWAGQKFEGSQVVSQGDMRLAFMNNPSNLLQSNNEFSINQQNNPMARYKSRGINSQLSREPRVPNMNKKLSDGTCLQISSVMPDNKLPYLGEEPRPSFMSIYDNEDGYIYPHMQKNYTNNDLKQAFTVSDTIDQFMNVKKEKDNPLLNENTNDNKLLISQKFKNMNTEDNNEQILSTLNLILTRLTKIEKQLHSSSRNSYDIVLYIVIGMLISFLLYSIISTLKKN